MEIKGLNTVTSTIKLVMKISFAETDIEVNENTALEHGFPKRYNMTCKENDLPDQKTRNLELRWEISQHSIMKWW